MDEQWQYRTRTSVLADLGPLPEVIETNSETLWKMFVELDEQHTASFVKTVPSSIGDLGSEDRQPAGDLSVQVVMAEATRHTGSARSPRSGSVCMPCWRRWLRTRRRR
jgi:hypothetical protein